jgi:SAM-dependent methyltransferase
LWAHPVAQLLAGPALRPGGRALTNRILDRLELGPRARVLDVGSGTGATLDELAARGVAGVGVDYSDTLAALAHDAAPVAIGDGESLPFAADAFDAVLAECVLSALPDKHAALTEVRRVLRAGGRFVLTDMVVNGEFPEPLRSVAAWAACIGGACSVDEYGALLDAHGFVTSWRIDAGMELRALVDQAQRRLAMLRGAMAVGVVRVTDDVFADALTALGVPLTADAVVGLADLLFDQVRVAVADGRLGYVALTAG